MSPRDLVKVAGFGRSVCVISVHHVVCGQVIVVQLILVEDAGFSSSRSGAGVHWVVRPLRVAQESGFQCRVQGKEGLDQRSLRLCSQCGAARMDVVPVLHKIRSVLVCWFHCHCGGPEHGTRTWSTLSRPPLFMLMEPPQRSLLSLLLPALPLPPAGQRSVKLPLFQLLEALEDKHMDYDY